MTDRELMQQALEALEFFWNAGYRNIADQQKALITALRERLAQPEQEPVTWRNAAIRVGEDLCSVGPFGYYDMTAQQWLDWALSVVTVHAPPQPAQQPLTDEQISDLWCKVSNTDFVTIDTHEFARAIEAVHGIGEKPDAA